MLSTCALTWEMCAHASCFMPRSVCLLLSGRVCLCLQFSLCLEVGVLKLARDQTTFSCFRPSELHQTASSRPYITDHKPSTSLYSHVNFVTDGKVQFSNFLLVVRSQILDNVRFFIIIGNLSQYLNSLSLLWLGLICFTVYNYFPGNQMPNSVELIKKIGRYRFIFNKKPKR